MANCRQVIIATGSEVGIAIDGAKKLSAKVCAVCVQCRFPARVCLLGFSLSMCCWVSVGPVCRVSVRRCVVGYECDGVSAVGCGHRFASCPCPAPSCSTRSPRSTGASSHPSCRSLCQLLCRSLCRRLSCLQSLPFLFAVDSVVRSCRSLIWVVRLWSSGRVVGRICVFVLSMCS